MLTAIAPQRPAPVFRSATELVTIPVILTNRNGEPVADLVEADFDITANGRSQRIAQFRFVSVPLAHRESLESPPASDVVTNAHPSAESRQFAIVVDDRHLVESDLVSIRRVISQFIQDIWADDEVGIVFTGRSDLGIDFTKDTRQLTATIGRIQRSARLWPGRWAITEVPRGIQALDYVHSPECS